MELYHMTPNANVESILRTGIRPSVRGADGPGVYVWVGPESTAVEAADCFCRDGHYLMSDEEYDAHIRGMSVIKAIVPDDVIITVEWKDYVVLRDAVPPEHLELIGNFYECSCYWASQRRKES